MYPSLAAYKEAIAQYKVEPKTIDAHARRYKAFRRRSVEAFKAFVASQGLSTTEYLYRGRFQGFVNDTTQGLFCAWVEALLYAHGLHKGHPGKSAGLFAVYMTSLDIKLSEQDVTKGRMDDPAKKRWAAWCAASAFWKSVEDERKLRSKSGSKSSSKAGSSTPR